MAGISIRIDVKDEAVRRGLAELMRKGRNLRHVLDVIGADLVSSTSQRFIDEKDPEGKTWAPLAAATLLGRAGPKKYKKDGTLRKRAIDRIMGARILNDTGDLARSLTHKAEDTAVAVGTIQPYARIHQLGGEAGRGRSTKITARPYLGVSASDRETIGRRLAGYLGAAA